MAEKFHEAAQRGESPGLNIDELSFDDTLATNEAVVRELGDATLKKIDVELTQNLRKSMTVDWAADAPPIPFSGHLTSASHAKDVYLGFKALT
jgi:type I site-specific restriction-modification system R (restriction) subunit